MKLLVTKINNIPKTINATFNVIELANQFHCKIEPQGDNLIIIKNSQLTEDEFSILAGKLVLAGFNVERIL